MVHFAKVFDFVKLDGILPVGAASALTMWLVPRGVDGRSIEDARVSFWMWSGLAGVEPDKAKMSSSVSSGRAGNVSGNKGGKSSSF
jgi:hypothetical protein